MRSARLASVFSVLFFVSFAASHIALARSQNNILTTAEWRENIEFVARAIKNNHPDPFAYTPEPEFDARLSHLRDRLSSLKDHQVLVELMATVASLKDGHTAIRGGFSFLSGRYPFQFYAFRDGLHVTAANDSYQSLVASLLISVGNIPATEALMRVSRMAPHENEMTQLARAPAFLSIPEALEALGLAQSLEQAEFLFRRVDGTESSIIATPGSFEEQLYWGGDATPAERPLRRQRRGRNYWSEYQEDVGLLYVQFNRVRNDDEQSIAEFAAELATIEEGSAARCVLLDIRDNGGGNDYFNRPMVEWATRSPSAAKGQFFVAIGRGTFSAAQKLATRLALETEVTFIGEPTGSRPNHFGDSESFDLPHGDLTLSVSSIYWEDAGPGDSRESLEPDILITESSADWFSFGDPVLEYLVDRCE